MDAWPDLATPGWQEAQATLHMWSQIVGKTRLALEPMQNHWWQVTLAVTPVGLATPLLTDGDRAFAVELDLVHHALRARDATGREVGFALEPMTVAEFYARYQGALATLGVAPKILARPVEVEPAIPFATDDVHRHYDPAWATALAGALRAAHAVLAEHRGGFVGKCSPVHFFWGSFDLACTRFSGRPAAAHPGGAPNCADWVMREAYSHECASAGFWTGDARQPEAVFYAYAYPEPKGYAGAPLRPPIARWDAGWHEFMLPYAAARRAADPRRAVLDFLESTYAAAADLAGWDRAALERSREEA